MMIKLVIFEIIFLFSFGLITTKLLKGKLYYCAAIEGDSFIHKYNIKTRNDCLDFGGDWINS